MASLYIKDGETAALAARVAARLGTSKTEAVRRALHRIEAELPDPVESQSTIAWLREFRRRTPLKPTGLVADKAFYDSLYDGGGEAP